MERKESRMKMFSSKSLSLCLVLAAFTLTGCEDLKNAAHYFVPYQYGSYKPANIIGGSAPMEFQALERQADKSYLDFFAVGCAGSGNQGQHKLAELMAGTAEKQNASFVLYLGDNFYGAGVKSVTDKQWKTKFEDVFSQPSLAIPFYAVLGNHDYLRNPQAQVEYTALSTRWKMPERYYTFSRTLADGTLADFFALDTEPIHQGGGKEQIAWLEDKLSNSNADWKIVFGHHPVYTGDKLHRGKTRNVKEALEPLLIRYGVRLYLSAHSHNIEVMRELSGVNYVISGAGSRPRNVYWGEDTRFAYAAIGFTSLQVSKENIGVQVIGLDEDPVKYAFTIEKNKPADSAEEAAKSAL